MTKEQEDEINRKLQERQQKKVGVKKHSRKGISAEVFGDFNKKGEFTAKVIKKSEESITFLKNLLLKSIMFQNLSEENLKIVIDAMEELKFTPEMEVIKEGDAGDMLYVIGSGEYECTKVINGKKTYLKTYKTGELFG
jgi:cAMP-dependent protein kinase regulator